MSRCRVGSRRLSGTARRLSLIHISASVADHCLLQLESAWNLPSPPAHEDARRALKLQAMKAAMESRRAPPQPTRTPDELFADVLRQPTLNEEQQVRLDALLQALRRRGPPS